MCLVCVGWWPEQDLDITILASISLFGDLLGPMRPHPASIAVESWYESVPNGRQIGRILSENWTGLVRVRIAISISLLKSLSLLNSNQSSCSFKFEIVTTFSPFAWQSEIVWQLLWSPRTILIWSTGLLLVQWALVITCLSVIRLAPQEPPLSTNLATQGYSFGLVSSPFKILFLRSLLLAIPHWQSAGTSSEKNWM